MRAWQKRTAFLVNFYVSFRRPLPVWIIRPTIVTPYIAFLIKKQAFFAGSAAFFITEAIGSPRYHNLVIYSRFPNVAILNSFRFAAK